MYRWVGRSTRICVRNVYTCDTIKNMKKWSTLIYCMCTYIYICMCVYMCVHVYMHIYMYIYMYTCRIHFRRLHTCGLFSASSKVLGDNQLPRVTNCSRHCLSPRNLHVYVRVHVQKNERSTYTTCTCIYTSTSACTPVDVLGICWLHETTLVARHSGRCCMVEVPDCTTDTITPII